MKRIHKVLIPSLLALSLGLSFVGVINNLKEPIKESQASNTYHTTGFYQKVTDISHINDGDKVLIVIYDNQVLARFGGNPASALFETSGVYASDGYKFLGLDDALGTEFTVGIDNNGYYSFRGTMEMDLQGPYDCLLAHVPYNTATGFPTIGYYTGDRFGAYKYSDHANDNKTKWTLSYNTDTESSENITMTNVYTSDCSRSYAIYRKCIGGYSFSEAYEGDFREYYVNDNIRLEGYYVDVDDGMWGTSDRLYYEVNKPLFYMDDPKVKSGQTEYVVKIHGLTDEFIIHIFEPTICPHYYFHKEETYSSSKDYRGTYLLVEGSGYYYNGRYPHFDYEESNATACTIENDNVVADYEAMLEQVVIIEKVELNGEFVYVARNDELFAKYYSNPYLNGRDDYSWNYHFIETTSSISESNVITIKEHADGGVTFGFTDKWGDFFGFSYEEYDNVFYFETHDTHPDARLFKLSATQKFNDDVDGFISLFLEKTGSCDATGHARTVFDNQWDDLESEFKMLGADAQGYFANLTYTHNAETSGTAKDIIDRYDYLISKYTDLWDFMDRKSMSSYQNVVNPQPSSTFVKLVTNNVAELIVIISVLSISFVAAVVVTIKKRKEQ